MLLRNHIQSTTNRSAKNKNKKAQLSLGNTQYSLYSSYCSTELTFKVIEGQWFPSYMKGLAISY